MTGATLRRIILLFGYGVFLDLRNRIPYYKSDWTDAYNYRVVPSVVFIFFTNLLPAIAFAQDMFDRTNNSYGVNEILLSSALGGLVFGIFAGQPLCIVGVTGPISIFNYTVYDMVKDRPSCNYFSFMCWIGLWSCAMHLIIALSNAAMFTRYITRFSCDAFGMFINCIYVQKGIQILTRQFPSSSEHDGKTLATGYFSVVVGLLMAICGTGAHTFGSETHYFHPVVRKVFADYGTPLCVVFFTGFVHFNKHTMVDLPKLAIAKSFVPTDTSAERNYGQWFIRFWENISIGNIFLAMPFGLLLTLLFYFDHNVSSLMAQDSRFRLRKPSAFHWDFFLLGITTGITGLIGVPFPNGLIPQAPLHTTSLCCYKRVPKPLGKKDDDQNIDTSEKSVDTNDEDGENIYQMQLIGVVEQRLTNTGQGLLTLGMMSHPLLIVLGTVPQAVFAGLFFIMGLTGLNGNEIVQKIRYLCTDKRFLNQNPRYATFGKLSSIKWLYLYTGINLIAFACEFAICQTKAAIAFPAVLLFFAAVAMLLPKIFPHDDHRLLDEPTGSDELLKTLQIGSSSKKESTDA